MSSSRMCRFRGNWTCFMIILVVIHLGLFYVRLFYTSETRECFGNPKMRKEDSNGSYITLSRSRFSTQSPSDHVSLSMAAMKPHFVSQVTTLTPEHAPFKGVIFLTGYRTGSTLMASFVSKHKDFHYIFEPLYRETELVERLDEATIVRELNASLNCDFHNIQFDDWHRKAFCRFGDCGPLDRTGDCGEDEESTRAPHYNQSLAEEICRSKTYTVLKTIRVRHIKYLEPLMRSGYKVIQLLRDPRAVIGSQSEGEVDNDTVIYPRLWSCQDAADDYDYIQRQINNNHNNNNQQVYSSYWRVRYEDLVLNTTQTVYQMYKFLEIAPDDCVIEWVSDFIRMKEGTGRHIKSESRLGISRKDPAKSLTKWKNVLSPRQIRHIEETCSRYMELFGYQNHSPN